ncbi:uncharacterized protein K452DRAFT_223435 [Aplosporella prunicola CBS 121167]|uniref:Fungal lipase-type domain-containing protein n=1 Tax=Aplosporella prunicola CBS 121167 TaxID=1176127 RepID=A0A6A6BJN4_9PEZI|nr:uncharacterized protein K452DRAFT_223435 [Aplosporella prunicola CBS 121167]KAF2144332.1 hypothetical protein K452DRAFT_223435 [Aplosporella prunicola CBS 121167]
MYHASSSPAWLPPPENTGPYLSPPDPYGAYGDASQSYVSFPGTQSSNSFVASGSQLALDKPTSGLRGTLRKPRHLASQSFSNLRDALNEQISPPAELICQKSRLASQSVTNLNETFHEKTTQYMAQTSALCDAISNKLDEILTCIDSGRFGGETEPVMHQYPQYQQPQYSPPLGYENDPKGTQSGQLSTQTNANHFSKVWLYGNSRLPPYLPPLKVYMPTWPLLCLAAQYSEKAYYRPTGGESETHVDANWRSGTKAMVLKSVPVDDMNTIVFAIRGSQTFMDWAVNFRPAPSSPKDFLDDPGNMVHAGFLYVARKMVAPVAARLRTLLSENPHRSTCSLLITGHSAGGAVAALLYAHMLSTTVQSELTRLTDFFKRVHCVTFGAPPVTLLPLSKPPSPRHKKSLFFAFINEGDPVIRADKEVIKSLLRLYANPAPHNSSLATLSSATLQSSANLLGVGKKAAAAAKRPHQPKASSWSAPAPAHLLPMPSWKVPPGTLSCAGKLVLLRDRPGARHPGAALQHSHNDHDLEACVVEDEQLRAVIFGDPVCHMMRLYARRIEVLATRAVTVGGMG